MGRNRNIVVLLGFEGSDFNEIIQTKAEEVWDLR